MDENLYNYESFYGNGLASQAYSPSNAFKPKLTTSRPITSTASPEVNIGVSPVASKTAADGKGWLNNPNVQAWGQLGLGLASYLDQRKTAGLQRDAMRQNLAVAREHQANRKALGESWNKGWGQ